MAVLCFLFTEIAHSYPNFIEHFYSQTVYPLIAKTLSNFSSVFTFSLDDVFYSLLLITPLVLVFLLILRKISFITCGKIIVNTIASIYLLFYFFWGFNYFRENLAERLEIQDSEADKKAFIETTENIITHTNSLYSSFNLDKNAVDSLVEESYKNLASVLKIKYPMGTRNDKKITFSGFFAKSGITGYFGPFFNEVHVNKKALPMEYPFILAHEKAHQLGVTSEAEANFYAWIVCSYSSSREIQYSANLVILYHFIIQAYPLDEFPDLVKKIDPKVRKDINNRRAYWQELRNEKLDKAASKANDVYLKTNKIKAGIKDYRGVVEHLMNFSLDSAFQQRHHLVAK